MTDYLRLRSKSKTQLIHGGKAFPVSFGDDGGGTNAPDYCFAITWTLLRPRSVSRLWTGYGY